MRLSSLRALLLVLAMVAQTVAGGAVLARAAAFSPQQTLSATCHQFHDAEQSGPADKAGHRPDCQSCFLCAGAPPVWIAAAWTTHAAASVDYALIAFNAADSPALAARAARSHCARAPPGALA